MLRRYKDHQRRAARFLREHNLRGLLAMEPGTGKTLVGIREAVTPALVICRRDDFMTWRLELEREGDVPCVIESSKDVPDYYDCYHNSWTLVTYDLCKQKRVADFIKSVPWQTVVADESHQIKRMASQRTKAIIRCTRHIPNRIAATGTPLTNDPLDVFSQCLFVDDGQTFGRKEWDFLNRYYLKPPDGMGWFLRKTAKVEIAEKLKKIAYHVKADDGLDLPPEATIVKSVPMSPAQTQMYEQILDTWEYELSNLNEPVEIDQVIVQLSKLRQVSGGFLYYFKDRECLSCDWAGQLPPVESKCPRCQARVSSPVKEVKWLDSSPPKVQLLKNLVEEINKPKIVVWCAHTAEIRMLQSLLPKSIAFTGSMSTRLREIARQQFRDNPDFKYFIGQVDAGVGMNELVVADTAIYYSNSFKVASRLQSMARIRRIGSERHKSITYYDLVSEKTVDVKIIKGLSSAINLAGEILAALRKNKKLREVLHD